MGIGMDLCNEVAALCICSLPGGHTEPHLCECGGGWIGSFNDKARGFTIVGIPGSNIRFVPTEVIEGTTE